MIEYPSGDLFGPEILGLERGRVRVVPYDPRWAELFEQSANELRRVLRSRILAVEHTGSTAVPGLAAKPILDLLVVVPAFDACSDIIADLSQLHFEFRPQEEIPDRHYLRIVLADGRRTHHLSLAESGSDYYRRTLGFRDALRENEDLRRSYETLKIDLARRYPLDREAYLAGKTEFVLSVLRSRGLYQ